MYYSFYVHKINFQGCDQYRVGYIFAQTNEELKNGQHDNYFFPEYTSKDSVEMYVKLFNKYCSNTRPITDLSNKDDELRGKRHIIFRSGGDIEYIEREIAIFMLSQ